MDFSKQRMANTSSARPLVVMKAQVGGCQVPGLKDAPDPVGSEDLKTKLYEQISGLKTRGMVFLIKPFNNFETIVIYLQVYG